MHIQQPAKKCSVLSNVLIASALGCMNAYGQCAVLTAAQKPHSTLSWLILQCENKTTSAAFSCTSSRAAATTAVVTCQLVTSAACRQAIEERQDALTHELQSLEEDRNLLKQYRDTDTVVDPRAGAEAKVERARSNSNSTHSACIDLSVPN